MSLGAPPCGKGHRALEMLEMHKLCSAQGLQSPKLISVLFWVVLDTHLLVWVSE